MAVKKQLVSLERLQRTLREAQSMVTMVSEETAGQALTIEQQQRAFVREVAAQNAAFVLAYVCDEPCPLSLFKPWASARRIKQWRDQGLLKSCQMRNGKMTCLPSEFFAFYRTLNDTGRRGRAA